MSVTKEPQKLDLTTPPAPPVVTEPRVVTPPVVAERTVAKSAPEPVVAKKPAPKKAAPKKPAAKAASTPQAVQMKRIVIVGMYDRRVTLDLVAGTYHNDDNLHAGPIEVTGSGDTLELQMDYLDLSRLDDVNDYRPFRIVRTKGGA